jgi:hypothetical protein
MELVDFSALLQAPKYFPVNIKTKSYNFKHNFVHGKQHLSSLLASLNILAFLVHTVLEWFDQCYAVREFLRGQDQEGF